MTAQPTEADAPAPAPAAPPIAKPEFIVKPEADSRLEALCARRPAAQAAYAAAKEALEEINNGIKAGMVDAAPGETHIRLNSEYLDTPLRLVRTAGAWRIDTKRMKKEAPRLYVEYAEQGKPTWTLTEVKGG